MDTSSELRAAAVELKVAAYDAIELLASNELANLRSSEADERDPTPGGAAVRTVVLTRVAEYRIQIQYIINNNTV